MMGILFISPILTFISFFNEVEMIYCYEQILEKSN